VLAAVIASKLAGSQVRADAEEGEVAAANATRVNVHLAVDEDAAARLAQWLAGIGGRAGG
jgi:hypothetical protein